MATMMNRPKIAIAVVTPNVLVNLGLKSIIERIVPMVEVWTFTSVEQMAEVEVLFFHHFVSAQILLENSSRLLGGYHKPIVLTDSVAPIAELAGVPHLNINQGEEALVRDILRLHNHAHPGGKHPLAVGDAVHHAAGGHHHSHPHSEFGHPHGDHSHPHGEHVHPHSHPCPHDGAASQSNGVVLESEEVLTAREVEVLSLIVKGLLNKEIADRLNISLTTVISHRRNIVEKLGMRSVSALTIYAVMRGYVSINEI